MPKKRKPSIEKRAAHYLKIAYRILSETDRYAMERTQINYAIAKLVNNDLMNEVVVEEVNRALDVKEK